MDHVYADMSDREMFKILLDKLDRHIENQNRDFKEVWKAIADVDKKLEGHGVRLGTMAAGIAFVVTAIVSWVLAQIGVTK